MRFQTVLQLNGKTATGFVVPPEIVEELGSGKRPAVIVRIGAHSYRSTIATMSGQYMVGLSAENRAAAGVAAGDRIEVELELDTAPRKVVVPADLAAALARDPAAKARFDALSYSGKRQHTLSVEGAKTEATRQRRIEKAIASLRG